MRPVFTIFRNLRIASRGYIVLGIALIIINGLAGFATLDSHDLGHQPESYTEMAQNTLLETETDSDSGDTRPRLQLRDYQPSKTADMIAPILIFHTNLRKRVAGVESG